MGSAGWIIGIGVGLLKAPDTPADILLDVVVVFLLASGVLLTGVIIWCLYLSGRRLRVLFVVEALLAASLVFGTIALVWVHARGVLPLAVTGDATGGQPWESLARTLPPELAYAAPGLIGSLMVFLWWFSHRKQSLGAHAALHRDAAGSQPPDQQL